MCEIAFEYDFYENVINMNIINTNCSVVSRYAYCVSPTWGGEGDLVVSEDGGEHMVSGRTGGEGYQSSLTEYKWGTIEN